MPDFNKRIFGSDIDPRIKNKLLARQALAENPNPNESTQFMEVAGKQVDIKEAIGTHNFSGDDDKAPYLFELSSRTPWARAWVAVELYYYSPEELSRGKTKYHGYGLYKKGTNELMGADPITSTNSEYKVPGYVTERKILEEEVKYFMERKVYVLGDNNYNIFSNESNLHAPIEGRTSGETGPGNSIRDILGKESGNKVLGETFPGQMQNNPFMKPPAGITSIETKTSGFAGAIKHTTVNFMVHNFEDFQNIYSRFFLKPGATVVVDFGWDTAQAYNPDSLVGEDIKTEIFGTGKIVDSRAGDLEVVVGKVSDFTSTVDEAGSFICSMTIVSDNAGLLDYEISDENKLRAQMVDNLSTIIINKVGTKLNSSFLRDDWTSDSKLIEESNAYANTWAHKLFSGGKTTNITTEALKVGLYWQSMGTQKTVIKERFLIDETAETAMSNDNNLFVSWAFFEEELLNSHLGFMFNKSTFGGHFNSIDSFVSYDTNLISRQNIPSATSRNKTGFRFLYPLSWGHGETYDTIHHKDKVEFRDRPDADTLGKEMIQEDHTLGLDDLDKKAKRIPLRELFININVIQSAFENNSNVSEAIAEILDVLNEDSQNIFNLKLISGTRDNSTMTIVDTNFYHSSYNEVNLGKFENLFVFSPYSKGSIVKEMSLTYQTPNNALQTMIAIQNKSANIQLFPKTEMENTNQALRTIYGMLGHSEYAKYGVRHHFAPDTLGKNNQEETVNEIEKRKVNYNLLEPNVKLAESIVGNYKVIIDSSEKWRMSTEGQKFYKGLYDDHHVEDKPESEDKGDAGRTALPPDVIYSDAIYAKDIEQYYEYRCKRYFTHERLSPLVPIELSLTTYGVSGILPGDIFNIDYLPVQYRERTYFQVMNVEHSVDTTGWKTTFQTQMRVKSGPLEYTSAFKKSDIYLSTKSELLSSILDKTVRNFFKDFQLDDSTTNLVTVFRVKGRLDNKIYEAEKSMNDDGQYKNWRSDDVRNQANNKQISEEAPQSIKVKLDKSYTLLIGNGGAIAIDESSEYWKQSGKIDRLIGYFERFVQFPNSFSAVSTAELHAGGL